MQRFGFILAQAILAQANIGSGTRTSKFQVIARCLNPFCSGPILNHAGPNWAKKVAHRFGGGGPPRRKGQGLRVKD